MGYIYNPENRQLYKTVRFIAERSKYGKDVQFEARVSTYIDESVLWRLTEDNTREMIRNIRFPIDKFTTRLGVISKPEGKKHRNVVRIIFTEKDAKHEYPVIIDLRYETVASYTLTRQDIEPNIVEMTELILNRLRLESSVSITDDRLCEGQAGLPI